MLGAAIVLWGVAMISSATVSSFGDLLVTRVALGAVTAAAGPVVASLVGDYFAGAERGRIYGYILRESWQAQVSALPSPATSRRCRGVRRSSCLRCPLSRWRG